MNEITQLQLLILELREMYPKSLVYVRGDSNVNYKNKDRSIIFSNFLNNHNFEQVTVPHNTYHHFLGGGLFDSKLDVILVPDNAASSEDITHIICKYGNDLVESHHDIILSALKLPVSTNDDDQEDLIVAPKVENNRVKIIWEDDKISDYQEEVSSKLVHLRTTWPSQPSLSQLSILLELSNFILTEAATNTNKHIKLGDQKTDKKSCVPFKIKKLQCHLKRNLKL